MIVYLIDVTDTPIIFHKKLITHIKESLIWIDKKNKICIM